MGMRTSRPYSTTQHAPIRPGMHWRAAAGIVIALAVGMASACATNARPQPFPSPTPPDQPLAADAPEPMRVPAIELRDGFAIAQTALQLRGLPYRLGGTDPRGFDCSGLVQYVFSLHGITLPRVVRDQFQVGRNVSLDALEPGDLVFFRTEGDAVSHVGIAIGGDRFVHAPNAREPVKTSSLVSGYWAERVEGARRLE